jgi:hypothetical protein
MLLNLLNGDLEMLFGNKKRKENERANLHNN